MNPKVTIIIPVYNGANFLGEAIDSALAQTYKNIEIIVVNDGSNDDSETEKVAKSYGSKIKYYRKENGGVATALNLGLKKMTGEYFSWLSHDDKYKPDKLEKQISFLSRAEDKDIILYSNYDLIDENGKYTGKCKFNHDTLERTQVYGLLRGNVNGITMLVPKAAFDKYGEFDESLRCTQDYDMWYRMMKTYKFVHLNDILSTTRIHSKQDTQSSPRVISEGNILWINMVSKLSDSEKIKAEGSLIHFYVEMIKFARQTPYAGAVEYYRQQLIEVAQTNDAAKDGVKNVLTAHEVYDLLVSEDQKRAAAYYIENVLKQMVSSGKAKEAAGILSTKLIGKATGLDENSIESYYLPQISNKSNKPRLMFCTGHWLTGGMERVLSNLFGQLKDDYDLFLLTAYDGRQGKVDLPSYVTHIKMSNELFYDAYSQTALAFALLFDVDIAIGFMNLFNGQLDFYEICDGTRIKTVASNNEIYLYPYHNPYYYGLIQRRIDIFKKLDATLWLTNFSAAAYGLVGDNSYLMPNLNSYKVQNTTSGDKKIILCVGRFNDYIKRVDRMLKCFSIVSKTQPDAKLMLVGKCDRNVSIKPNDETTINDLMEQLHIDEEKVVFVGEVNDMEKYYSQASLLLMTSSSEGFGMVISEAACFGVPTVCNKIPGLEDLITDGENGYLPDQDDIEAMAKDVSLILSDEQLRNKLGENARRMVTRFDEKVVGNKWKYLVNTLLETNQPDRKLKETLGYQVKDYKDFSRVLFDELGKVIVVNHEDRTELLKPKYVSTISFISGRTKHNYTRLHKSIKKKGALKTGGTLAKLTYHKAKRLYNKP